jgi:putative iron-dependent peroxidase
MPFGNLGDAEFGTYFIGYSATPDVTEEMLRNMFIGKPPGNYDRILDFSTAVTGTLFFVPSADFLDKLPASAGGGAADAPVTTDISSSVVEDAPNGSLNIGSLRGTPSL